MSDIADFLRARLAEQRALAESAAEQAQSGDWRYKAGSDYVSAVQTFPNEVPARREHWIPLVTEAGSFVGDMLDDEIGQHIAANDPATVIADCDAKLALIDHMVRMLTAAKGDTEVDHYGALDAAEQTLGLLAQPFAGHPDHKGEEWAP